MPQVQRIPITERERQQIRRYAQANKHLKQADIVAWATNTLGREVNQSIVSRSLHSRYEYLDSKTLMPREAGSKRGQSPDHPVLEKALWEWFSQMEAQGITVSGDMIQEAAHTLWQTMPDFILLRDREPAWSHGWLTRFKKRHAIRRYKQAGEAADADTTNSTSEIQRIQSIAKGYAAKDIFNADETGLFWLMTPDYTLATRPRAGGKKRKDRLTVLPTCNADGTEKLDLWVIGYSANPRAFGSKLRYIQGLPFVWRHNGRAWMTSQIFVEYLKWFDAQMNGRKVLLLVDNFSSHGCGLRQISGATGGSPILINTRVEFLPANTTSIYQPLDQGIIKNLKVHYRRQWLQQVVSLTMANKDPYKGTTVLDAIHWIIEAWGKVTRETISNCWRHSQLFGLVYGPQKMPPGWNEEMHLMRLAEKAKQQGLIRQRMNIANLIAAPEEDIVDSSEDLLAHVAETCTEVETTDPAVEDIEQQVVQPCKPGVLLDALNLVLQNVPLGDTQNLAAVAFLRRYRFEVAQLAVSEDSKKRQQTLNSFFRRVT